MRALFVTVDPERDTPAVIKDYLSSFDPRIIGVTGDAGRDRGRGEGLSGLCQEGADSTAAATPWITPRSSI